MIESASSNYLDCDDHTYTYLRHNGHTHTAFVLQNHTKNPEVVKFERIVTLNVLLVLYRNLVKMVWRYQDKHFDTIKSIFELHYTNKNTIIQLFRVNYVNYFPSLTSEYNQ